MLTLQEYIDSILISEDNPGILFTWNESLGIFVLNANRLLDHVLPPWITSAAGHMTRFTFEQDVINYLASIGGGSYGRVFVASNDLIQYTQVCTRLKDIELNSFIQAAMVGIPTGSSLASTAVVFERGDILGIPIRLVAPPLPALQVFN